MKCGRQYNKLPMVSDKFVMCSCGSRTLAKVRQQVVRRVKAA